jgi:hypothetical protein
MVSRTNSLTARRPARVPRARAGRQGNVPDDQVMPVSDLADVEIE